MGESRKMGQKFTIIQCDQVIFKDGMGLQKKPPQSTSLTIWSLQADEAANRIVCMGQTTLLWHCKGMFQVHNVSRVVKSPRSKTINQCQLCVWGVWVSECVCINL